MDDLTTFLNSVESSARKILKQQNKKQQQQAVRDRVALAKGSSHSVPQTNGTSHTPTRDELRVTYGSGGSLVIAAPVSLIINNQLHTAKLPQSPSRSEYGEDDGTLPRLPPARSPVASVPPGSIYSPLQLPAINRKGKLVPGSNNTPGKRSAALKLLESPLYKSLTKLRADQGGFGVPAVTPPGQKLKKTLHEVDNVALLLRKMGLHDSTGAASPAHRADHAVDKRMCNACWAKPDKMTGCEHHPRVYPSGRSAKTVEGDAVALLTSLELQGPTSWMSDDLFVKYRSEKDREKLWFAYVELKKQQQEIEMGGTANAKEQASLAVIPIVTRHPVCTLFEALQTLDNLRIQAQTRKRNLTKTFIIDVNHIWLTNLDHFNHQPTRHRILEETPEFEREMIDPESHSLSDRRDERAIREGYSQIQSISSTRALKHTVSIGGGPSYQLKPTAQAALLHFGSTRRRKVSSRGGTRFRPLSLLICGRWDPEIHPNVLNRVPGVALVGNNPVLWWRYEPDDKALEEGISPPEYTKVVALFARNSKLSSTNSIHVSLVLALDAPILSPLWFAWHVGSKMPPPELEAAFNLLAEAETGFGRVLAFVSPCLQSLLNTRLDSMLDELLPGTITLLNDAAHEEDHWLQLTELHSASVGHRRGWSEFTDRHIFRQWLLLTQGRTMTPRFDVMVQYCSVTTAHPNAPGVCGRYCWHETDPVIHHLCRRRMEKDMLYLIQNHLTSGPNDPTYFSVTMSHECMSDVLGARLSSYLSMVAQREARAAYEKKMYEIELKLEAGRLALEAKRQEQKRLSDEGEKKTEENADESSKTNQSAIAAASRASATSSAASTITVDLHDEMSTLMEEGMDISKSTLVAAKMAKLQLQHVSLTRIKVSQPGINRGEGWKRLKTSRLPPNFARTVYKTHTEGPRSSFINETNHATPVGMLDPADCSPYEPPEFIPELRAHFVPRPSEDLQEKKRQWAEHLRTQQTSGHSAVRRGAVSVPEGELTDEVLEHDSNQPKESKEQCEARALLCARNNNLEGLELALDQGVDVNTRDNHGNTLFILVCQQGNKRLAKFLMRRRADMNLQNLNGNTALHYLYAYKHNDLAEYIKTKGAKDTTQNAAGLTCYEGLSQNDVDGI